MSLFNLLLLGVGACAAIGVLVYNRLVALQQAWKNAFADIDVQLKQRHDLVPNLVATVKGYASHENEVFTKVTEARAHAMSATTLAQKGVSEAQLSGALANLFAVAENYPDLKANEGFRQLQDELGDIENKIAAARRFFNNSVAEYNTSIGQFPAALFAHLVGFKPATMFALEGDDKVEANQAPKVSFGT